MIYNILYIGEWFHDGCIIILIYCVLGLSQNQFVHILCTGCEGFVKLWGLRENHLGKDVFEGFSSSSSSCCPRSI